MSMQQVQSIVVMCESERGGGGGGCSPPHFPLFCSRAQRLLLRFSASGVLDGDLVFSAGMVKLAIVECERLDGTFETSLFVYIYFFFKQPLAYRASVSIDWATATVTTLLELDLLIYIYMTLQLTTNERRTPQSRSVLN
ncbi:unnamed protein product [Arctogadus glacialis]